MKRLILLIALLLSPLIAQGQVVVAGSLVDAGLTTVSNSGTFARFTLQNYAGQPRVASTGILVKLSIDCTQAIITAGNCKVTANSAITPAGTRWQVCFYNNRIRVGCLNYTIGASFNLNTATPI